MAEFVDQKLMHPMSEKEKPFIELDIEDIHNENWFDPKKGGKWMLFYDPHLMDKKWQEVVTLYRNKELTGIQSIKCSTAVPNPRAGNHNNGAIRFVCGPYDDSEAILNYGMNIAEKMNYANSYGWAAYKTDEQSAVGAAGSRARKYYYRIRVPTIQSQQVTGKDDIRLPTQLDEATDIMTERCDSIVSKYMSDFSDVGMFTLNIGIHSLNSSWVKACKLYRAGELPGVAYIKTYRVHTDQTICTISFFCGPKHDIPLMKSCGRTIAEKMSYVWQSGKLYFYVLNENRESITSFYLDAPKSSAK